MTIVTERHAIVGISDHAGWAVFVTVGSDGAVLDRRSVELIEEGVPKMPHHHDAQGLPLPQAAALVAQVRESAQRQARQRFDELAGAVPAPIVGVALRVCQPLPETLAERLSNYRAQNVADWVMYRQVLAESAVAKGWLVHWYDPKLVFAEAARALGRKSIDDLLETTGAALGPPWQKDHKLAMAAAIASPH
ncbi:MAG TPA: hypothetical protein VEX18_21395 [Polyangiaceae bacterium]|nr:hypothetical protein [Polyangiaceae bacterium]